MDGSHISPASGVHVCRQEILLFAVFQAGVGKCDLGGNTTLCLVKPHAVKAGLAGQIISKIQQVRSDTHVTSLETNNWVISREPMD